MSAARPPGRARNVLVRAGLDPRRARDEFGRAGLLSSPDVDPVTEVGDLLEVLSLAADPDAALLTICGLAAAHPDRFAEVRADEDWLRRVVAVGGGSRPLGDLLTQDLGALEILHTPRPITVEEMSRLVEDAVAACPGDPDAQSAGATRVRRRATTNIAARDLLGEIAVETVAAELSALAEGVLRGTLAALHREIGGPAPAARILIVGMGKLGGEELNYISDVDVLFVHEPTGDDEQAATDEARRVCETLLTVLNASTAAGRAYEVDPTLRPEGRTGALTRTVDSFVHYWDRWARTWEFQAMLKARPVAGDLDLGQRFLAAAEPYVFPDHLDPEVVGEIRRMKGRVEAKPEVRRDGDRQIKLGPGGLRDIEFAVQLLQVVHGRADPDLRLTGTLPSLAALAAGGYVDDMDAEVFGAAYRTLRSVEHRLQLANERRTHTVPDDDERQERIARSLGYRATPDEGARVAFVRDLRRVQAEVRELHAKLFYRPLLESHAAVPVEDADIATARRLGDDAARERLAALGFADAAAALRDVRSLTSGMSRSARALQVVLPAFLHALADAPDPNVGLRRFRDLAEARAGSPTFLSRLRDHPPTVAGLARALGTSDVAADLLVAEPAGLDWLDEAELQGDAPSREEVVAGAMSRLAWQDPMPALRRFKRHLLLRTVLRDLLADVSVGSVGDELSVVAEALVEVGLRDVLTELAMQRGGGRPDDLPMRMAVIGMGKFGGHELHYASDLDIMFVHEPVAGADRSEVHALANQAAERLMNTLGAVTAEGTAFEMDADLRPEGRAGPLSRSLESFGAYYERWSEPWEHQALTKARPVAGDPDLGARLMELARPLAHPEHFTEEDARRMRRMKARLEKERIRRRQDPKRHLKLGPGGLSDVEWTTQLLQRRHGADHAVLRTSNTMAVLDALQDLSLIEHRDAQWLRQGYRFLSRVRNRLYLCRQRDVDVLPNNPVFLTQLAHGLGFGPAGRQEFEDEYLRHTRHIRRVSERLFFEVESTSNGR